MQPKIIKNFNASTKLTFFKHYRKDHFLKIACTHSKYQRSNQS